MLVSIRINGFWSPFYSGVIEFSGSKPYPNAPESVAGLSHDAYWIGDINRRAESAFYGQEEVVNGLLCCVKGDTARLLECNDSEGTTLKAGDKVAFGGDSCMRGEVVAIPNKMYTTGYRGAHLAATIKFADPSYNNGRAKVIKETRSLLKIG